MNEVDLLYLNKNNPRLAEIVADSLGSPLSNVSMWGKWQNKVKDGLPNFAADPFYLTQIYPKEWYDLAAEYASSRGIAYVPSRATRDVDFGAVAYNTEKMGPLTRSWIDGAIEADFINRHMPGALTSILNVGAGYGRFAVEYEASTPGVDIYCVDAVPVSTFLCEYYTGKFGTNIRTFTLSDFEKERKNLKIDLMVNIHSWNECSYDQVAQWIGIALWMKIPYIFTVSHDPTWYTWPPRGPSFRNLLLENFDIVAEENIGVTRDANGEFVQKGGQLCPHVLWKRKDE